MKTLAKKLLSALLGLTFIATMTVPTTGCSAASTENDINAILTAAQNVVQETDPNAPWLPQLTAAIAEVKTAEATWVAGGAKQDVINALNILAQVSALIPLTAAYSPLIDVLVAGIDVVLNLFGAAPPATVGAVANVHEGRVVIHHKLFGNRASEFVAQWNKTAEATGFTHATVAAQ